MAAKGFQDGVRSSYWFCCDFITLHSGTVLDMMFTTVC